MEALESLFARALKLEAPWKITKRSSQDDKRHWSGVPRSYDSKINNGILEGLNSLVQAAKAKARGYRTFKNLRTMIYM